MADNIYNVLGFAAMIAYLVFSVRRRNKEKRIFAACAERLRIENFAYTSASITGAVRGMALDVRFLEATKQSPAHETITVACAPCAIALELRRQTADEQRSVERGQAIDVFVGDPAFDATWIVEGAPPERVIRLLSDPPLRAQLLAFAQLDGPSLVVADGKLTLHRSGTDVGDEAIATERIELALAFATAVIVDAETPLAPREIDVASAGYRSANRGDPTAAEASSLVELRRVQATRALDQLRVAALAVNGFVTLLLLALQLSSEAGAFFSIPLLLVVGIVDGVIASQYAKHRKAAPSVPIDLRTIEWMIGLGALDLLLTVRAVFVALR
jgi:hypothetical protein